VAQAVAEGAAAAAPAAPLHPAPKPAQRGAGGTECQGALLWKWQECPLVFVRWCNVVY